MSKRRSGQHFHPAKKRGERGAAANRHRRQRYAANISEHSSPAIYVRVWRDDDGNVIRSEEIGPVKK